MSVEKGSLIRNIDSEMSNDYYQQLEVIDVDKIVQDAYLDPYNPEICLEELSEYEYDYLSHFSFLIIEAFDKVFIGMSQLGDTPSTVYKNKDGQVCCCSGDYCVPDLQQGTYYVGDELTVIGQDEPYETDSSWLWNSIERNPKVKALGISVNTMKKLIEVRKEELLKLEEDR